MVKNRSETEPTNHHYRAATLHLILLSNQLKEFVLYRPKGLPAAQAGSAGLPYKPIPLTQLVPSILQSASLYPDLVRYFQSRFGSGRDDCELGATFKIGVNISKIIVHGFSVPIKSKKSNLYRRKQ